jgi:diacylglycerol kinase family enzyme
MLFPARRFAVILNESAGRVRNAPEATRRAIADAFADRGLEARVELCAADAMDGALAKVHRDAVDAIVIGGGDGTIAHAAAGLCHDGMPLGILPMGTFNLLARDLHLPASPDAAVEALSHAQTRRVDVGIVNGHTFLRHASLGIHPWVVRRRDVKHSRTRLGRMVATFTTALRGMRFSPSLEVTFTRDGRSHHARCRALAVTVGNVERGFAPAWRRETTDAGYLAVYAAREGREPLRTLWSAFHGRSHEGDTLDLWSTTELDVAARHSPLPVALDGDVVGIDVPLQFRILPGALTVLVPDEA